MLTNFPEFMEFLFKLIAPHKHILVRITPATSNPKVDYLKQLPAKQFGALVEKLSNSIAILVIGLTEEQDTKPQLQFAIRSLDFMDQANRITSPSKISQREFVNETVSDNLNMNYIAKQYYQRNKKHPGVQGADFVYLDYPWMFSTAAKVDVLQSEAKLV